MDADRAGPVTIRARAADDSANLSGASAGPTVTVAGRSCPCTLFGGTTPSGTVENDGFPIEAGVLFRSDEPGTITGLRYYKGAGATWTGTRSDISGARTARNSHRPSSLASRRPAGSGSR